MKTTILSLFVLFGIFAGSFGQKNLAKCPDIKPVEPIEIESVSLIQEILERKN